MSSFNKGEWSELYSILFLLIKPKIQIVDEYMENISDQIFEVKKIIAETSIDLEYCIVNNYVLIYANKELYEEMSLSEVECVKEKMLSEILSANYKSGSFEIPSLEEFINSFSNGHSIKSDSNNKSDIKMLVFDNFQREHKKLSYSIKSSLGRPATILNSSGHTNFKYKILNFDDEKMKIINSINTRTKLLDRIDKIKELEGIIVFDKVVSNLLDYNLKLIDSNMSYYLANALLYSYEENNKDLKEIFIISNDFDDEYFGYKKLSDFLDGASFGFFPSIKWDGKRDVDGGILFVKHNGDVVLLDLIYNEDSVREYLLNETKLDSPSSTRYHMVEVFKENDDYYFTLNLQIRYKR